VTTLPDPETDAAIRTRVEALRPDAAARWGKMNARQMIYHLTDSFRVALRALSTSPCVQKVVIRG
jgi:hypothetical protein